MDTQALHPLEIKEIIEKAERISIFTHDFPDGDAVGSVVAMYLLCKHLNKKAKVFFSGLNAELWSFVPELSAICCDSVEDTANNFLAIVVDSSNPQRLGKNEKYLKLASTIINIDHHPDNSNFGDINTVNSTCCSVGEIIFYLLADMGITLNQEMARVLLISIITDTGRFKYSNVKPDIFRIIATLIEISGVEIYLEIVRKLYAENSIFKQRLVAEAIKNIDFIKPNIAFSYIALDCGLEDGLIDPILSIKGVEVAVLARIHSDILKLSFRAKNKEINVKDLAARFGGGGHINASGASIKLSKFKNQIKEIRDTIANYFLINDN